MIQFFQDLRYGVRLLGKNPGYTAVAVIALGLGIGANSANFAAVQAILLRPLPFPALDRIVMLWETLPRLRTERDPVAPANFVDWREQSKVFEHIAAYRGWSVNLTGADQPERIQGFLVSPSFFPLLRMSPLLGRMFTTEEEQAGRDRVVIVSHGLWQGRLGADPNVVGARLTLNGRGFTVVGVMPPDLDFPLGAEVWAPLALTAEERSQRGTHSLSVLARLKPGVSLAQARAEMAGIAGRLERLYPLTNTGRGALLVPLREAVMSVVTNRFILVGLAAAGFVLLLACANVANLQLARMSGRRREIALRAALGAGRGRILRQLLWESVLVALVGGVLGVFLAMWSLDLMKATIPAQVYKWIAGLRNMEVDASVLGWTLALALATGVISGLVPAFQVSGTKALSTLNDALKEGGRGASPGLGRRRARSLLVISEVALALVLLVGAGLMVKAFRHMLRVNAGFDPAHLLTMRVALPAAQCDQVLERLGALPGVQAAGAASNLGAAETFLIEGRPAPEPGEPRPEVQPVSAHYFRALGISLLKGRPVAEQDRAEAPRVAVLSQSVARHYWPGAEDPIGRRIKLSGAESGWLTVVGVVGDVKDWFSGEPQPAVYLPYPQAPQLSMRLLLRTTGDPMRVVAGARAQILAVDPDQPIYDVKTMEQVLSEQTSGVRLSASMMGAFAVIALVLAAAGIYAVISCLVAQRTHEIGVRMALGARRRDVLNLVVGYALKLALAGLAIGLPAAYAMTRVMSSALYGVIALDVATFAGFTLLLAAVALLAGYVPARRATGIEPVVALRYE